MSIEKILAISGKPGLYALKLQTRTGFVAESLTDGKKVTVGLRSNVSLLSEISVYTYDGEVRLAEVFKAIAEKEDNGAAISHKEDNATLESYFREVLPEFDEDRVYASDIKKILNWYNMLQAKGLVNKEEEISTEEAEAPAEEEAKTEK
ncbi:DUF5606 domain-containing protein [Flavobacterium sp. D11R37]|jgi:hypothetical protein|uniref:DUF5606 family protein n=1 Tax=Flavobacterium coralii TaxID=2838017 RepID=UPI001CA725F1|nr:DUF5606 domain-containing protein [Flavobacterium coralii]MBY8963933.1 DUF5606 domain-containing protein [Flavobacterium coralii]